MPSRRQRNKTRVLVVLIAIAIWAFVFVPTKYDPELLLGVVYGLISEWAWRK